MINLFRLKAFFAYVTGTLFICFAFMVGVLLFLTHHHHVDFSLLEQLDTSRPTILLDDAGAEWARFSKDKRIARAYSDMPDSLIQAFLATEDRAFFNHHGVSLKGIIRSLVVNIVHGRVVQGASTITQQLVKLLFLDSKKTISRKIKEQVYSLLVEQQYTKEQILQTYLNHVYFGCGIYGVEAASIRFWGKSVEELTVDEAAVLAGIVKSPNQYCPLLHPLSCQQRRNTVLQNMVSAGYITQDACNEYMQKPLALAVLDQKTVGAHAKEAIRQFLEDQFGRTAVYHTGLVVQTTINQTLQAEADQVFAAECKKIQDRLHRTVDGALICLNNATGGISALVGGYDFSVSKFNRALQARRQIGSIIKPLVFAVALEKGLRFSDVEVDEPLEITYDRTVWKPRNYDREFHGPTTLASALSYSNNIVTIKTLLKTGIQPIIDLAKQLGMQGPFDPYPSLALGCVDATLKEVVGMFATFARGGVYINPHYVVWVKDTWGTKLWRQPVSVTRVIPSTIADQVASVLRLSPDRLQTHYGNNWIDSQSIGKTGTTNDSRTCWYAGATPDYTTAVYIGCDDNSSMGNAYPLRTAFPIWHGLHKTISSTHKTFSFDRSLRWITINETTGKPTRLDDDEAITFLQ